MRLEKGIKAHKNGGLMITYSKSLNLYPIFTGIGLIFALCAGFSLFKEPSKSARACFFIGNGAYYAVSPGESVNNPPIQDSFKDTHEFINAFQPDSILCDVVRAFYEKEPNIFVTYKTWASFVRLKNRLQNIFTSVGVSNPLEQVYINDSISLDSNLESTLLADLKTDTIHPDKDVISSKSSRAPIFYLPSTINTQDFNQKDLLQYCGALHPNFAKYFHFLYLFKPEEWRMYDTGIGLFYLTPHDSITPSINTRNFKPLNPSTADSTEFITQELFTKDYEWTKQLDQVFTPSNTSWQVYVTGHGSDPIQDGNDYVEEKLCKDEQGEYYIHAWMAGMRSNKFAPFLHFLNTTLKTETLFINSCFTSAERTKNLISKDQAPTFTIVSPIATTHNSVSNYVFPLFTTTYVPSSLTQDKKAIIETELRDNNDDNGQVFSVNKYESLLTVTHNRQELLENIHLFFQNKPDDSPSLIAAYNNQVEKLQA